jgi:hypothetical protein
MDWMFFFDTGVVRPYTLGHMFQGTGLPMTTGLPQEHACIGTYRKGRAAVSLDPGDVCAGTTTGKILE